MLTVSPVDVTVVVITDGGCVVRTNSVVIALSADAVGVIDTTLIGVSCDNVHGRIATTSAADGRRWSGR